MKTITGKLVICAILISLAFAPINRSSAQFVGCESGGGGDPPPTPTPTPACYYEYYDYYETNCDPGTWSCCDDHYLITYYYCYGVLVSTDYQLLDHSCRECDSWFPC